MISIDDVIAGIKILNVVMKGIDRFKELINDYKIMKNLIKRQNKNTKDCINAMENYAKNKDRDKYIKELKQFKKNLIDILKQYDTYIDNKYQKEHDKIINELRELELKYSLPRDDIFTKELDKMHDEWKEARNKLINEEQKQKTTK